MKKSQCFLLFVDVGCESSDICVSFGIPIKVKELVRANGGEHLSMEGKLNT